MKPRHIAVMLEKDISIWALRNKLTSYQGFSRWKPIMSDLLRYQVEQSIPIMTVYLLRSGHEDAVWFTDCLEPLAELFDELSQSELITDEGVKISVMGRWYSLPNRQVEAIKRVMESTDKNENYFLNFCVQYDACEEIVDACRVLARKVQADKIDPEAITPEILKENLYFSGFMPPDVVIVCGEKSMDGFMLWDMADSQLHFTNKPWTELNLFDVKKAVDLFELVGHGINR